MVKEVLRTIYNNHSKSFQWIHAIQWLFTLKWINEAINEFSVALKKDNSSLIHQWKNKLQWIKDTHL